jgi:hypothetical protein
MILHRRFLLQERRQFVVTCQRELMLACPGGDLARTLERSPIIPAESNHMRKISTIAFDDDGATAAETDPKRHNLIARQPNIYRHGRNLEMFMPRDRTAGQF